MVARVVGWEPQCRRRRFGRSVLRAVGADRWEWNAGPNLVERRGADVLVVTRMVHMVMSEESKNLNKNHNLPKLWVVGIGGVFRRIPTRPSAEQNIPPVLRIAILLSFPSEIRGVGFDRTKHEPRQTSLESVESVEMEGNLVRPRTRIPLLPAGVVRRSE